MQMKKFPKTIVSVATIASRLRGSRIFCKFYASNKPRIDFFLLQIRLKKDISL